MKYRIIVAGHDFGIVETKDPLAWVQDRLEAGLVSEDKPPCLSISSIESR